MSDPIGRDTSREAREVNDELLKRVGAELNLETRPGWDGTQRLIIPVTTPRDNNR